MRVISLRNSVEFEGEYLNGELNGKIKEYYHNGKLKFEGEFVNGKRNGKGKEYNYDYNLLFEGKYLYDFKRKGKEYYLNGKLKYEGEYLFDNKYNGKGYDKINGDLKNYLKINNIMINCLILIFKANSY